MSRLTVVSREAKKEHLVLLACFFPNCADKPTVHWLVGKTLHWLDILLSILSGMAWHGPASSHFIYLFIYIKYCANLQIGVFKHRYKQSTLFII